MADTDGRASSTLTTRRSQGTGAKRTATFSRPGEPRERQRGARRDSSDGKTTLRPGQPRRVSSGIATRVPALAARAGRSVIPERGLAFWADMLSGLALLGTLAGLLWWIAGVLAPMTSVALDMPSMAALSRL